MKTKVILFLTIILISCSRGKFGYDCEGKSKILNHEDVFEQDTNFNMTYKEAKKNTQKFKDKYSKTHTCDCYQTTKNYDPFNLELQ